MKYLWSVTACCHSSTTVYRKSTTACTSNTSETSLTSHESPQYIPTVVIHTLLHTLVVIPMMLFLHSLMLVPVFQPFLHTHTLYAQILHNLAVVSTYKLNSDFDLNFDTQRRSAITQGTSYLQHYQQNLTLSLGLCVLVDYKLTYKCD